MSDLRSRVQDSLSGTYTIERELGGGGMSRVFVADETRLGRKVVVKVLSPELAAAMSASRFDREIRLAASLQQANIVPVFSTGELDGLPYYTMPYVEGESLRARLGRGVVPIAEVVSILRDVSRALAYAHEHGVVHRDIKPDNVLLSGHTAVVTDFGIAKAIAAAAELPPSATLTQLGTAVGTPAYMAPEQAAGDPATDHRADIYAVGCMAYELLAGHAPFAGLPPHKLLAAHMSDTPTPVAELRADCPPALASLVEQCLEKDPAARPASASELLHRLDAVASPSAANAAMPALLMGGRSMLWRALGAYAGAFAIVAIVARAATNAIGLPDWVVPGALVVMALGHPVILFTGYAQYIARRAAAATPTYTPGGTPSLTQPRGTMANIAIKASPHISWKRTARGGMFALGAFVLLVAGYMALRGLGIGPAGSLLAAGKLAESDKVLVASFDAPASDASLGPTIAEAVRTNLSESRVVRVLPTSTIVTTLESMQRPDTARVDVATAREIAQRTGAKAVIAGSIVPTGTGYLVTVRLLVPESGDELASYHESAKDAGDLIPAVDRLTKSLRGKIGESLADVRSAPALDQVTTASLGALRSYTAGLHANDVEGDFPGAIQHFQDAIAQDSTFAMAHVQLAYSLMTIGGRARTVEADRQLTTAYNLRNRLPERERWNVEGAYYTVVSPDRRKAIPALRRAVELDSSNADAANSLGIILADTRDVAGSEKAYRLALATEPTNGTLLSNLATMYSFAGKFGAVDSVLAVMAKNAPFPTTGLKFGSLWAQHEYDAAERLIRPAADSAPSSKTVPQFGFMVGVAGARGRVHEMERRNADNNVARARFRGDSANPYAEASFHATVEGELRQNRARGLAILDSVLRASPIASMPNDRDQSMGIALAYARLGAPDKARVVLAEHQSRLDSLAVRREFATAARVRGMIALDEGQVDSAIVWFRRGDTDADGLPTSNCMVCTPLTIGEAFDVGKQADSARTYLTQYVNATGSGRSGVDRFYLGPVLFRLGELYENAHDAAHATEYYGRFVDLWSKADPEFQPRVADARRRMEELNRGKR
jgi:tetratricopeptide (TPR) repeat protein